MKILVPVRYPISQISLKTLEEAVELTETEDADLTVLHVDLFQESEEVKTTDLRREVESELGDIDADYTVREGFLVEESILEEAASRDVDLIVIGKSQRSRLRRALRRMVGNDPNIGEYLRERLDTDIHVVS